MYLTKGKQHETVSEFESGDLKFEVVLNTNSGNFTLAHADNFGHLYSWLTRSSIELLRKDAQLLWSVQIPETDYDDYYEQWLSNRAEAPFSDRALDDAPADMDFDELADIS